MNTNFYGNPFDLRQADAYLAWRESKLTNYPTNATDLIVEVRDIGQLTRAEHVALLARCRHANMVIYSNNSELSVDKNQIHALGLQLGLNRLDHNPGADEDAISAITTQDSAYHKEFIPYTNKPIAWHTDGYYNSPLQQVQSFILHCVQPAEEGGFNQLIDNELLYIAIRDHNPEFVRALMHPQTMIIPANIINGIEVRAASFGPVFSINQDGSLHLRYTDRTRSIVWRNDPVTQAAVTFVKNWLHNPNAGSRVVICLKTGQGIITNNVLHTRSAFVNGTKPRLLYRARYYDRIHNFL